jgi:dihydroorotase
MSLPDVIERATSRAAAAMRRPDLGTLRPGSAADIALFRLEEGEHTFHDIHMNARTGGQRLISTQTLIDGEVLPRLPERELAPWAVLPDHQRIVLQPV